MVECHECGQPVYGQPLMYVGLAFCSHVCRDDHTMVAGDARPDELVLTHEGMGSDA